MSEELLTDEEISNARRSVALPNEEGYIYMVVFADEVGLAVAKAQRDKMLKLGYRKPHPCPACKEKRAIEAVYGSDGTICPTCKGTGIDNTVRDGVADVIQRICRDAITDGSCINHGDCAERQCVSAIDYAKQILAITEEAIRKEERERILSQMALERCDPDVMPYFEDYYYLPKSVWKALKEGG